MTDDIAARLDHTLLDPLANAAAVANAVNIALNHGCASVCINAGRVQLAADILTGESLPICSVIGFPFGATATAAKVAETHTARDEGASEFDMVLDLGRFFDGNLAGAGSDIASVKKACGDLVLKVIIESAALTIEQVAEASRLAVDNGADFVKTSTGYHASGGATTEAVVVMRETVGPDVGVKASGGIRNLADAKAMLAAGATRLGVSRTIDILS